MTRADLTSKLGALWTFTAPEKYFMEFILDFDDWCAIEWGISTKHLGNTQLFNLLQEYCEHLKK